MHSCPEQLKGAITIRNTCLLWFHPAVCEKHETVRTASAKITSLFITLPAPHLSLCTRFKFQPGGCSWLVLNSWANLSFGVLINFVLLKKACESRIQSKYKTWCISRLGYLWWLDIPLPALIAHLNLYVFSKHRKTVLKKTLFFSALVSKLNMGLINKGWYGMFFACGSEVWLM